MASLGPREELIDDLNNDNPVFGLKGSCSLENRFTYRLSRMLDRPVAVVRARGSQSTLSIYIGPGHTSESTSLTLDDKRAHEFANNLQELLRDIAEGSRTDEASQDLWDVVLLYVSVDIHAILLDLQQVFANHGNKFDAMLSQNLGLDDVDEFGSSLDIELGNSVIKMQQSATSYSGTVKQQNELIEFACELIQHCHALNVRLDYLLGSAFAEQLYDLICSLSRPMSTVNTMIRTASTFPGFHAVSIHVGIRPPPSLKARSSSRKTSTFPQNTRISRSRQPPSTLHSFVVPRRLIPPPQGTMLDTIRPYLLEKDRGLSVFHLTPASKQETAILIGCIRHKYPVPPGSETYYLFGFAACRNVQEVQDLANIYQDLLDTTLQPPTVFQSLIKALDCNTLPGLLCNKTPHDLQTSLPAVHDFLCLSPDLRFSVHRLVQFIRDTDADEPPPCLKRDYGFKLCKQREEVAKLKKLYASIIEKVSAAQLHYACVYGRLKHFAVATLGTVGSDMGRLLQNDYPSSWVGFDVLEGCGGVSGPLFKRSLK